MQLWDSFIKLTGQIVSPDWGSLVALIPLGVAALVVMWLVWVVLRLVRAAPARRGYRPVPRRPSGEAHMPGPSFAPVFAALGAFLLFLGFVLGGMALWLGVGALALTLLYWGREAMHDYDRLEQPSMLPAVPHEGPPPGVHMPGPSFRPILASIAVATLFFGLVFGGALLVVGVIVLAISLLGWLRDARTEYRAVEEADRTGHIATGLAPGYPIGTLAAFVVLIAIGVALNSGLIPPQNASGGGSGGSGSPAPSASAPASGPASGAPAPSGDVTIHAQNISFDTKDVIAPAGRPFTIVFVNDDAGVPHNVSIHKDSPTGLEVWKGDIFNGVDTRVYNVPALDAGTYGFACSVHPNMTGTLTVK